jgi:hypothetical protein
VTRTMRKERTQMSRHSLRACRFVAIAFAMVIPAPGQSQTALPPISPPSGPPQATPAPQVTVFLADPQLGVVGAVVQGDTILYFESVTPAGSTLSARLLDSAGRTIAISGHSMDARWLASTDYDAVGAAQSLTLAPSLVNQVGSALPAGALFAQETAAIGNLARAGAMQTPGMVPLSADSATMSLPAAAPNRAALAAQYDLADAQNLGYARDVEGNLNVTYKGTALRAQVVNLPNDVNDETGALGVTEVNAQIRTSDGTPIATQLGGDDIPDGWDTNMFPDTEPSDIPPIQWYTAVGKAKRAALLLGRYPYIGTATEAGALSALALGTNHDGVDLDLLPQPMAADSASADTSTGVSAAAAGTYYSRTAVWRKPLVGIGWNGFNLFEHSGTIVRHGRRNSSGGVTWKTKTVYCNHGTCPGASGMSFKCTTPNPGRSKYYYAPHYVIPAGQTGAGSGRAHSCAHTGYSPFSGVQCRVCVLGICGCVTGCHPGHNCHDDSWTQVRAIRGESYHLQGGARCEDCIFYGWSPSCQD